MKRKFPLPLTINCDGLSKKRTVELANLLVPHFDQVSLCGEDIVADKPLSGFHYDAAWKILDRYGITDC